MNVTDDQALVRRVNDQRNTMTITQSRASQIERVVLTNDLSTLDDESLVTYYIRVCESLGLNWTTRPFSLIAFQGKTVLYANKDASEQLRQKHHVSIPRLERDRYDDVYVVTAYARLPSGREDSSTGAVSIAGLKGEALANAYMKAETKAKRRVSLSICGLGMLDESEVDSIPGSERVDLPELPAAVDDDSPGTRLFLQELDEADTLVSDDAPAVQLDTGDPWDFGQCYELWEHSKVPNLPKPLKNQNAKYYAGWQRVYQMKSNADTPV